MKLPVLMTKIHKWIALIVGIQLFLWVLGGLVMSWFPIDIVRGEHNIRAREAVALTAGHTLLPVAEILESAGAAQSVELKILLDRPVYQVSRLAGDVVLVDAESGGTLTPLNEEWALKIARADFAEAAGTVSASLIDAHNAEYRGPLPVWRIAMGDGENTRLYVSPLTGRVAARRNDTWRLYDFFWMLHIMDYENRTDFNHPLIIVTSIIALIAAISGIWLIFYRFGKRDFRWMGYK